VQKPLSVWLFSKIWLLVKAVVTLVKAVRKQRRYYRLMFWICQTSRK